MKEQKFYRSVYDPCVYFKGQNIDDIVYLLLYVDYMLVASKDMKAIKKLKKNLEKEFEMKDLSAAIRILGMDIVRNRKEGTLMLSQEGYLKKVLRTFRMEDARSVVTPVSSQFKLKSLSDDEADFEAYYMNSIPYASAVGSLMYGMIGSRPDLAFAVGLVSRFMGRPGRVHWDAVKWILKYLKGSAKSCLTFKKHEKIDVQGFCDSDFAADLDKRRSVSGYVFKVGGNTISWRSTLQHVVALSTTEAEYMALTEAVKEALWLKGICGELGFNQDSVEIHCDSQSAISLAKNSVHHERTKHIDYKLHFIRDHITAGTIKVSKIHTSLNPADMLTKGVPGKKFDVCLGILNVI